MAASKQRPKMTFTPPSDPPQPVGTDAVPPPATDEKPRQKSRIGKRAVTFYVGSDAFRQLGVLSAQTDRTIQDLMQEAVDWLFQQHGLHRLAKDG
jgi:hypothetical protein